MLLRVEDFSAISGLTMQNAFILGDKIVGVACSEFEPRWAMYSIDINTFGVKELNVEFGQDIDQLLWDDIKYPIVVHEETAYSFFWDTGKIAAGNLGNNYFY
ncbi:hypothetical protein PENTCL1PPCAC_8319, partial [Pristionchus entomophagus]